MTLAIVLSAVITVNPSRMATATESQEYSATEAYDSYYIESSHNASSIGVHGTASGKKVRMMSFEIAESQYDVYRVESVTCRKTETTRAHFDAEDGLDEYDWSYDNVIDEDLTTVDALEAGAWISLSASGNAVRSVVVEGSERTQHGTFSTVIAFDRYTIHMVGTSRRSVALDIEIKKDFNVSSGSPTGVDATVTEASHGFAKSEYYVLGRHRHIVFTFEGFDGETVSATANALKSQVGEEYGHLFRWIPKRWETPSGSFLSGGSSRSVSFQFPSYESVPTNKIVAVFRYADGSPVVDESGDVVTHKVRQEDRIVVDL